MLRDACEEEQDPVPVLSMPLSMHRVVPPLRKLES
jgi:hypothetical protein